MTITRLGYEKVIEAFKEKLDEREEERTKLKKYHEGYLQGCNDPIFIFASHFLSA